MRNSEMHFDPGPRDDEIHDLTPASFRFILAVLLGIGVLLLAGTL